MWITYRHYTILYKGLEFSQISISAGGPGIQPHIHQGITVHVLAFKISSTFKH
jgi:hypothetical protein